MNPTNTNSLRECGGMQFTSEDGRLDIEAHDAAKLEEEIEISHRVALASEKLGKRLVKKTIRMAKSGEQSGQINRIQSLSLDRGYADEQSTTLALNAHLAQRDIPVQASVESEWSGSVIDSKHKNVLRVQRLGEEVPVDPKEVQ